MTGAPGDMTDDDGSGSALFVGSDLMAKARLDAAGRAAGIEVASTSPANLIAALRARRPRIVILDLDAGREAALDELARARAEGLVAGPVLAYFSHVDEGLGEAARAAGCVTLPRGRFWRTLPALLAEPARGGSHVSHRPE